MLFGRAGSGASRASQLGEVQTLTTPCLASCQLSEGHIEATSLDGNWRRITVDNMVGWDVRCEGGYNTRHQTWGIGPIDMPGHHHCDKHTNNRNPAQLCNNDNPPAQPSISHKPLPGE